MREIDKPRFTINDKGPSIDHHFGIMWANLDLQRDELTWQQALDFIAEINIGIHPNYGYTDWRMPTHKEINSLIEYSEYDPERPPDRPFSPTVIDALCWANGGSIASPEPWAGPDEIRVPDNYIYGGWNKHRTVLPVRSITN